MQTKSQERAPETLMTKTEEREVMHINEARVTYMVGYRRLVLDVFAATPYGSYDTGACGTYISKITEGYPRFKH
jgi:hypothetical protein